MVDTKKVCRNYKYISLDVLRTIFDKHDMEADDKDLITVLDIIKNNPYPFVNKEYAPILLVKIKHSTNDYLSNCFDRIIDREYLWEELL